MTRWVDKKMREERDKLIVELNHKGLTAAQIAPQVQLNVTYIRQILREVRDNQLKHVDE